MVEKRAGIAGAVWNMADGHLQPGEVELLMVRGSPEWAFENSAIWPALLKLRLAKLSQNHVLRGNILNLETCSSSALLYTMLCWDLTTVLLLLAPGIRLGQILQNLGDLGQGSSTLEGFSSWARDEPGTYHHMEEMVMRASPRNRASALFMFAELMTSAQPTQRSCRNSPDSPRQHRQPPPFVFKWKTSYINAGMWDLWRRGALTSHIFSHRAHLRPLLPASASMACFEQDRLGSRATFPLLSSACIHRKAAVLPRASHTSWNRSQRSNMRCGQAVPVQ